MMELEQKGFLRRKGKKGFLLKNKKELFKRWVTAYPEQLRPTIILGRYTLPNFRLYITENKLDEENFLWGGELAAEKLTDYLTAKNAVIYTNGDIDELVMKFRLRKDDNGNTLILKRFWHFEQKNAKHTVHPILLYADLLAMETERGIEVARKIYEDEIKQILD